MVRKYQVEALAAFCSLLLITICLSANRAASTSLPVKAAVFNFELIDTSHEGEIQGKRADETARLGQLDRVLSTRLADSGRYSLVDLAPVSGEINAAGELHSCNGCAADIAKKAGADVAILGWVQKVSNLILNVNVEIREAGTDKVLSRVSADIRGNTDESWRRGLDWLLRNRILKAGAGGG